MRGMIQTVWMAEQDALLGTMPDSELARRLGYSHSLVERRRHRMNIKTFGNLDQRTPYRNQGVCVSPERIHARRIDMNLLQRQVAELAGISSGCYGRIECGESRSVALRTLRGLARALQCAEEELIA